MELPLILQDLSVLGVSGTCGVAVKCVDITRNTGGEGSLLGQILTLMDESVGSETGLDTLVVHAVNDEH